MGSEDARRGTLSARPLHAGLAAALLILLMLPIAAAASLDASIGERLFRRQWVSAPASTRADDGLGPLFAAASCAACHPAGRASDRMVVRLAKGLAGDPTYGRQLQPFAVAGVPAEGDAHLALSDGRARTVATHKTVATQMAVATHLAYGALDPETAISLRRPLDLAGLGDADALGEDAILANEGVAGGRARRLADGRIGRFGWKASSADLDQQIAEAFSADMGLSTAARPDAWGDCTAVETACRASPAGARNGEAEIAPPILAAIRAYVAGLEPPPVRDDAHGAAAFAAAGCAACHVPVLRDGQGRSAQLYSDLLLHKMGPALDDGVAEPGASADEWRTPPLRGLGARLQNRLGLLHDGRAATIDHAIDAHGGDAAVARTAYDHLREDEKRSLRAYLEGL
jgi:CxxC motif-containing protein (DUF1111 family)